MSQLAWTRPPGITHPVVVLLHGWAGDRGVWERSGLADALREAGVTVLAPDLPGHAGSVELRVPIGRDPSAWAADAVAADLVALRVTDCAVVGFAEGGMVAGHLATSGQVPITGLGLVSSDDRGLPLQAGQAADALRDPSARVWTPEAADLVARVRARRDHDPEVLATWLERARWPSAARLGAVPMPVLVATGTDDPLRQRAPKLAALFRDGHLATAPGAGEDVLGAAELHTAIVSFLASGRR